MSIPKYTFDEIIGFLSQKNYDKFRFVDSYAFICTTDDIEILFDIKNGGISEELAELAAKVFENIDDCAEKAYNWLGHFDLKNDRSFSNAFDKGFEIIGIYFGEFGYGDQPKPQTDGFAISFTTINYYPCNFTVKYHKGMHPFAVEEWVV